MPGLLPEGYYIEALHLFLYVHKNKSIYSMYETDAKPKVMNFEATLKIHLNK